MTSRGVASFLLACALLAGAFYALLERHTELGTGPYRGEAARNPYLGFARLLEAMGLSVTVVDDLDALPALPPTNAALFMPGQRVYASERRVGELRDWVERGGHLILRA